jgi:hypothetical protein
MSLHDELHDLFGRIQDAPWPGEDQAMDRFLRHRARRGRMVVTAAGLALVAVLGAAVLVAREQPQDRPTIAPPATPVQVPDEGFQVSVPAGWRVDQKLTGTVSGPVPGGPTGIVGVVLAPATGTPAEATITVRADGSNQLWGEALWKGSKRRADGRRYLLRPGLRPRDVGQYLIQWPDFCPFDRSSCRRTSAWPRTLVVTGTAAPGDTAANQQVLSAMLRIVATMKPITDSRRPPPAPTVPANTRVLLGKGGTGRAAWVARIEPVGRTSGFSISFPWQQQHEPGKGRHWESLDEESLQRNGLSLFMDCLSWVPGSGLVLSGLAPEAVATVRIELAARPPVVTPTFARDKPVPWVAFVSPPLPAGSHVDQVIALDAAGRVIGSMEQPYPGALCGIGQVEPP